MLHSLTIGDWSGDGHGQCYEVIFKSYHNRQQIREAYLKAVKECGIAICDRTGIPAKILFNKYEDESIDDESIEKFKTIGLDLIDLGMVDRYNGKNCFESENIANLFLLMVKSQCPEFEYEILKIPSINAWGGWGFIGYGLLGS